MPYRADRVRVSSSSPEERRNAQATQNQNQEEGRNFGIAPIRHQRAPVESHEMRAEIDAGDDHEDDGDRLEQRRVEERKARVVA